MASTMVRVMGRVALPALHTQMPYPSLLSVPSLSCDGESGDSNSCCVVHVWTGACGARCTRTQGVQRRRHAGSEWVHAPHMLACRQPALLLRLARGAVQWPCCTFAVLASTPQRKCWGPSSFREWPARPPAHPPARPPARPPAQDKRR